MKNSLLSIAVFAASSLFQTFASANLVLPTAQDYRSGRQLCEIDYATIIAYEKGFYTLVPKDHSNPEGPKTPIYSYFSNGFDPKKDTMVYFTGGPGVTGHWGLFGEAMKFNVLIVDQRGIACSRPDTLVDYLSSAFYSSENVARDVEELRKSLKLEKIAIYGISYGTVPATIYASLFPNSARSLVLEGTLASGNGALWANADLQKLVQDLFDQLPKNIQTQIDRVHTEFGLPATWFYQMARTKLMYNEGSEVFRQELMSLQDEERLKALVKTVQDMLAPTDYTPHPLFPQNDIPYYMIACQELGLALQNSPVYYELKQGKFVPVTDPLSLQRCEQLKAKTRIAFEASRFPVKVPVTYFQGTDDSATVAAGALHHYATVPQGPKQFMMLERGGHNPSLTNIKMGDAVQLEVFELAVEGQKIPAEVLQRLPTSPTLKWLYKSESF